MADIGSLLLPDIDLMKGYEQSFARQQALKSYVYQDSEKKKGEFAEKNTFLFDKGISAYRGQVGAMTDKVAKFQKDLQVALQDRSRGGMWGLDPKTQADFLQSFYFHLMRNFP